MATLAVTNDFSAGTTAVAADVNQNFSDIETFVNSSPGVVQQDLANAQGDMIAATAANTMTRVAVGANGTVLTADSTAGTGVAWAATAADATKMPLAGGTFTGPVTFDGASPIVLEGATADGYETTIAVVDPTADRILTLPDATGTILTSGNPNDAVLTITEQTGTAYTLALTDGGTVVEANNAGTTTITVPLDAAVAFPIGAQIIVAAMGAGAVTIAATSGVTLRSKDSALSIDGQWATASLVKRATDEWLVFGALA